MSNSTGQSVAALSRSDGAKKIGFVRAIGGTLRTVWAKLFEGAVSIADFGAVNDGTDITAAYQAAVDWCIANNKSKILIPFGDWYQAGTVDLTTTGNPQPGISIVGLSRRYCRIWTDKDVDLYLHTERLTVRHMMIEQTLVGKGVAFRSNGQCRLCAWEDLDIQTFKYGCLQRYSIWNSWRDVYFVGNTCGIRLAHHDDMESQLNPDSLISWNLAGGWFNNQLTLDNVLCNGGEVGIWGSMMGASLNNVTCQNQLTDGTANTVLPVGQKGTGMWLEGGGDTSTDSFNNVLTNYYVEDTFIPLKICNTRKMVINGWFTQGFTVLGGGETLLEVYDSKVRIFGQTGQSGGWANRIVATDSVIVSDGELKADGGNDTLTNSYYNPFGIWTENGDIGSLTRPFREVHLSGDAYFGTAEANPAATADDGVVIDNIGRILASRNGATVDLNSRGVDGDVAIFRRSNAVVGKIAVSNAGGDLRSLYYLTPDVFVTSKDGSPEGVIDGVAGCLYMRTDGGAGSTMYVKETGVGNIGWVAK